ncbi:MAG: alpha/beta hydrolase [Clostridiales bacterium]|nr:alpha/beta hydrolase [Clostridiales bacterium]
MEEYIIKASDGTGLFVRNWLPEGAPKGIITLVHGLGEHGGRYGHVAQIFNENGFVFNSFDVRGHGRSGGIRGHVPSYDALMKDIDTALADISSKYPGIPHILYGHSLGGNQVLNYLLREASKPGKMPRLEGVIATGPALRVVKPPSAIIRLAAKILNVISPSMQMDNGLNADDLSHISSVVEKYRNDELVHPKATPRLYTGLTAAGEWAMEHAAEATIPCLVMHGGEDHITSPAASAQFSETGGKLYTFKQWDGLYHEIHNEESYPEVVDFMIKWIDKVISTKAG